MLAAPAKPALGKPVPVPPRRQDTSCSTISSSAATSPTAEVSFISTPPLCRSLDHGRSPLGNKPSFEQRRRRSSARSRTTTTPSPSGRVQGFDVNKNDGNVSRLPAGTANVPRGHGLLKQCVSGQLKTPQQTLLARIHANLAASSFAEHSTAWRQAKASGKANVLYNPIVQTAWTVAATIHSGQRRSDGGTMMAHLEETAITVAMLGMDAPPVAAALLHECLGEPDVTFEMLHSLTAPPVAALVEGVAKATRLTDLYGAEAELHDERETDKLLTMLLALGDARVLLIKLASRLEQARSMKQTPAPKRKQSVLITESVFVPLANRLGIWSLKAELEDLCFEASQPAVYKQLRTTVDSKLQQSQGAISEFISDTMQLLRERDIHVEDIEGRPKSLCSIQKKLQLGGRSGTMRSLDSLHDVLAVRIIVGSKNECYSTMRALTNRWPALPDREKNYIKAPKPNGYQSIHNVLLSDRGLPIEVQLRTPQMHWNAEYGVASHWRYKEGACHGREFAEEALASMHDQLVAWARMVLTYGHGVRDYRKSSGGAAYLRASSTLSEVTQALMAAGPSTIDNGELPSARPVPAAGAPRRASFQDFVASTMAQPAALQSVLVALTHAGRSEIRALDAAIGSSSVGELLCSGDGKLASVSPARVLVNGVPALGATHPLSMGDCVRVLPLGCPAVLISSVGQYFEGARTPLLSLRRQVMHALRERESDGSIWDVVERVEAMRDGFAATVARNMGHV